LTYVGAIAGVAHYLWLVKADTEQPLIYGFLLSILLGFRVLQSLRSNHPLPAANCDGDESRQRQVVTRMVEYRNVAVQGIKQPFHGFYRQEKFLGSQARCYLEEKSSLTRSKQ
jgi:DMSO/TMAO reductase YedYZ heme-binding membrane subunit